ncbi:MAG: histidinol-phosphate transaminase [Candidatus Nanopelagicales bacterium]
MTDQPTIRAALDDVPAYRAGKAAPRGAFKLSSNENPYPPLPAVQAAINDAASSVNRYPDFGSSLLLAAVAELHGVSEEMVALGAGSVALLAQAIQTVASVGDEVVLPWRSFEAYPILVALAGSTAVKVALRSDHTHDLGAMVDAITDRTRLVLLCSPNNPTGTVVGQRELEDFLARVSPDVAVAVDEAYIDFVQAPQKFDAVQLLADHPNLIVLRTFSKAYGLAGLRVGYALAQRRLAAALRKTQLPFGVTTVAQQAALASLASRPQLMTRVAQLVIERDRVFEELTKLDVDCPRTHANFVWLPLAGETAEFAEQCSAAGVVVRPFAGDGIRVTIGEPQGNGLFLDVARARFS